MQRKRLIIVSGGTLLAALGLSVGAQRPSKALATNKQSVLQSVIHRELTGPHIPDNQRFRLKLLTTPFHPHAIPPTAWQFPTILIQTIHPVSAWVAERYNHGIQETAVLSGSSPQHPASSELLFFPGPAALARQPWILSYTNGPIRIQQITGNIIRFTTSTGHRGQFNLATHQWKWNS